MADKQSEALRLANRLESDFIRSQTMLDAAAELRRLYAENESLRAALVAVEQMIDAAIAKKLKGGGNG